MILLFGIMTRNKKSLVHLPRRPLSSLTSPHFSYSFHLLFVYRFIRSLPVDFHLQRARKQPRKRRILNAPFFHDDGGSWMGNVSNETRTIWTLKRFFFVCFLVDFGRHHGNSPSSIELETGITPSSIHFPTLIFFINHFTHLLLWLRYHS